MRILVLLYKFVFSEHCFVFRGRKLPCRSVIIVSSRSNYSNYDTALKIMEECTGRVTTGVVAPLLYILILCYGRDGRSMWNIFPIYGTLVGNRRDSSLGWQRGFNEKNKL